MKEHDMEGKEERRCESYWGRQVEKERGVGFREEWSLQTADSLHSPHPVGQRRVLSIHILVAVSPFGDLNVRKEIQAFIFIYFFGGSNRINFSLCCHSALQPAWIQLPVRPHGKLLNHNFKSKSIGTLKARAPQGRSHFCMPVLLSLTSPLIFS